MTLCFQKVSDPKSLNEARNCIGHLDFLGVLCYHTHGMSSSLLAGSFVASILPGFGASCYFSFVIPSPVVLFPALRCGKFESEFVCD